MPIRIKKRIVEGIFNSILTYCLPVFGGCAKGDIEAIQVMQNKAARLVLGVGVRVSRQKLFSEVGWMSVRQLTCSYRTLYFEILDSKEPKYLYSFMCKKY